MSGIANFLSKLFGSKQPESETASNIGQGEPSESEEIRNIRPPESGSKEPGDTSPADASADFGGAD